MRHHLHPDLKNEYMMEENPRALWVALKDRYEQQKAVILPEAQREWSLLRFMDFKTIADYNSAVHKISAKLRFCDQPVNDATMIEKTLSTFLPANRILQQQYRNRAYVKYSDLIYNLLQAEKHDELLTRNHQMRPVGATPLPEVHFNAKKNKKFDPKKKNFKRKWNKNKTKNYKGSNKGKNTTKKPTYDKSKICQRCGCYSHTTNRCNTAKHLVELYKKSLDKGKQVKGEKFETHFNTQPTEASCSQDVPTEQQTNKVPSPVENIADVDEMMIEFQSNAMFGDLK